MLLTFLFDPDCGICTALSRWAAARDRHGRIAFLPNSTAGIGEIYGLSREDLDREAWAFGVDNGRFGGIAAVNQVLGELGGPWRALSWLYAIAPIRWVETIAYRWFATNRHSICKVVRAG